MLNRNHGLIVALLGGTIGALILATLIGSVTLWIGFQFDDPDQPCEEFMCFHGLAAVFLAVAVFLLTLPIGAGIGNWLVLRFRNHSRAGVTGLVTTAVLYGIGFTGWFALPFIVDLDRQLEFNERLSIGAWQLIAIVIAVMIPLSAILGRLIVLVLEALVLDSI